LVRPYTLTAGRTSSHVDLSLETPISTVIFAPAPRWPANDVRANILELATHSLSVAEIAARLSLPLGVTRVLIGDLVTEGYLRTHVTLATAANVEDRRKLIGRTLRGLRAL
jgi:predicted transcriptional regulator